MKKLAIFAIFLLSMTITSYAQDYDDKSTKAGSLTDKKGLSSENGRYAFGQISDYQKDKFMLDTKTGRLWQLVKVVVKDQDGTVNEKRSHNVLQEIRYVDEMTDKEYKDPR